MIEIKTYTEENQAPVNITTDIVNFLFKNLEQYGDPKYDIEKSIQYAMGENQKPGGILIIANDTDNDKMVGAVIINKTGMDGYIPENILVYIATDKEMRGKGVGKKLMQTAIDSSKGDMALHCEPDNPARFLYEKLGFSSKYLEMRLKK